jgi:diguanylate cyclase (GGDEF)-like protein/PAS domain S-box-containing protein
MVVPNWLTRRIGLLFPFGMAALVTVLAGAALLRLDDYRRQQSREMERSHVQKELELVRTRLEGELAEPLLETRAIAAQIIAHGEIDPREFEREAEVLTQNNPNIRNFVVSRKTVIAMVYPNDGRQPLVGFDYRNSAEKWPMVEAAIRSKRPVLSAPETLLQGGEGLILRDPVYLTDSGSGKERFYGLVSMVLDLPRTFASAGLTAKDLPLRVAVCTGCLPEPGQKLLFGDARIFNHNPVLMDVTLPYGVWRIAAEPLQGWRTSESLFSVPRTFGWCLFAFTAITSFGTAFFIVQRAEARRALSRSQQRVAREAERFQALLEQASDGIHILNAQGRVIEVSNSFCRMLGYSREEMLGKHPTDWVVGVSAGEIDERISDKLISDEPIRHEILHRRKDGTEFYVELTGCRLQVDGETILFYSSHDISERKSAERQINQLAFFDQLSGLPNRTLLLDRLQTAMAAGARSGKQGALLFIDLDDFKTLNDTLGHSMGDLLLKQVAERLSQCVRAEDTVARLGGDEFLVMTPSVGATLAAAAIECEALAERILTSLNRPYQLEPELSYRCTPSIGVTLFPGQDSNSSDLLKQADMAMYKAKAAGRNAIRFFDPGMEVAVRERAALEADLRGAIQRQEFVLHYQVQVDGAGRPTGAECLTRWQHPQRGLVPPGEFIPLAEETGLILPLGHWVLETACRQLAAWSARPGMEEFTLAVNVSIRQFRQPGFAAEVLEVIDLTGADPNRLKLELTESLLVENVDETIEKMVAMKMRGVSFSLDDFGTGYSSLSYLKRLPLDQLKIDQSFVRDALIDPNDAALAKTVVALGHSLGLGVIAEGVETAEQRDFLLRSGCNFFQGYFFGRPQPLAQFEEHLQRMQAGR